MINQGRYIVTAFLLSLFLFALIIVFKLLVNLERNKPDPGIQNTVQDTTKFSPLAIRGQQIFRSTCSACHAVFVDLVGPKLKGVEERGPWTDRKNIYEWIHNTVGFAAKSNYIQKLKERFGGLMMPSFMLPEKDIDALIEYINSVPNPSGQIEIAGR